MFRNPQTWFACVRYCFYGKKLEKMCLLFPTIPIVCLPRLTWLIHTSFNLKMESESKITIFGLKMMVKSGLKNIFLKFLHAGDYFPPLHKSTQNHQFSSKNNYLPTWRDFKINFSRPLFTIIFRPKMVFLVTDSILRVNPMFESVK